MPKTLEKVSPQEKKSHTAKSTPSSGEIALRAYHIFLERGATPGNEIEDWVRAERELIANSNGTRRKTRSRSVSA